MNAKDADEGMLRSLLGGVNGAGAHLVSTAPAHTKKMRFTFNQPLRDVRLEADLEDLTDDEAEEAEAGGMDADAPAGEVLTVDVPEESGMKKAARKPLPKRGMSSFYYAWQNTDLAQPNTPGMFDASFDGRMGLRPKQHRKKGKTTMHHAADSNHSVFARLGKEEKAKSTRHGILERSGAKREGAAKEGGAGR